MLKKIFLHTENGSVRRSGYTYRGGYTYSAGCTIQDCVNVMYNVYACIAVYYGKMSSIH
jgi:hypothetical protein